MSETHTIVRSIRNTQHTSIVSLSHFGPSIYTICTIPFTLHTIPSSLILSYIPMFILPVNYERYNTYTLSNSILVDTYTSSPESHSLVTTIVPPYIYIPTIVIYTSYLCVPLNMERQPLPYITQTLFLQTRNIMQPSYRNPSYIVILHSVTTTQNQFIILILVAHLLITT